MTINRKEPPEEHQALLRLSALCARAEHSSGEMRDKMRRWGLDEEAQDRIMRRLTGEKYVDDERFARLFARDKVRFDRWGRAKIAQALYRKGVAGDIATRVLDDIGDDEYLDALRPLLAAKRRTVSARSDYERDAKLVRFALSRGFGMHLIRRCIGTADDFDTGDCDG